MYSNYSTCWYDEGHGRLMILMQLEKMGKLKKIIFFKILERCINNKDEMN